ncbi:hypothetical protein ACQR7C_20485 [Salmonella enterica]
MPSVFVTDCRSHKRQQARGITALASGAQRPDFVVQVVWYAHGT